MKRPAEAGEQTFWSTPTIKQNEVLHRRSRETKFKPAFTQNNVDRKPDAPSLLGRCLRHILFISPPLAEQKAVVEEVKSTKSTLYSCLISAQ